MHSSNDFPVVARATASPPDANALKAMGIHYKFLMRVAQTLCVITQAKGVLLAGDNQVRLLIFQTTLVNLLTAPRSTTCPSSLHTPTI
jgi:hypothetical protein